MATITASTMESSQTLIQSETRYQEHSETKVKVKKTKSRRHHKDEGSISVSKSSEKLYKKMGALNSPEANPACEKCGRPVYAMERVKAERRVWHKECFRCTHCQKQLTVETYQSDHTTLYCRNHFKQLFEPKPVDEHDEPDATPKKHQLIICENNPVELPPDVVKASDKPDLGLEELSQLDVKSRFEVFEKKNKQEEQPPPEPKVPRERSTALLSKLAKFKAKGMDIGVSDEYLNGVPIEPSSSENEEGEEDDEDSVLKKSYKHSTTREQPISFCAMSEIVGKFENGDVASHERRRERKLEIQNIRTRLFMGKQAKIKEMYEQSVLQSEQSVSSSDKISKELELGSEKARAIKQKFENGQVFNDENQPPRRDIEDTTLFDEGISKKSRSIFLELDANAKNLGPASPTPQEPPKRKEIPFVPKDVVRASDKLEDVKIETADITDRFKFFETYQPKTERKEFRMTPPRQTQRAKSPSPEIYQEPSVARSDIISADTSLAVKAHTASKMISVFRDMEENRNQTDNQGPKPLKCFTPPPAGEQTHHPDYSEEESYSEEEEEEEEYHREEDEALKQAQQLARTTSFRDRFERPAPAPAPAARPRPLVVNRGNQHVDDEDGDSQLETARSLCEKFENMRSQSSVTKTTASRVNRFV